MPIATTATDSNPALARGDSAPSAEIAATAPGRYRVIRRNGKVTTFDKNKIKLAVTKAFLAVEGGNAAASSRIHQAVDRLTEQVTHALTRNVPDGGIFHIEDIQDQVELALMRGDHYKVARAYVLYREEHAKARAARSAQTIDNIGMENAEIRRRNLRLIIEQRFAGKAAELARALGKQPSEISRIFSLNLTHRRNIGSRLARRIEQMLGAETGWMDRQQITLQDQAHAETRLSGNVLAIQPHSRLPMVTSAQAKDTASSRQTVSLKAPTQEWITITASVGKRAYALRVLNDSMEPKFPEGVTIIIDPDAKPVHGSFVVAVLDDTGQITFKQFVMDGRHYLKPLNPRYPVMEMDDRTAICGVIKQMIMNFD
jgi:SOS-response transcriptional repressor LexA